MPDNDEETRVAFVRPVYPQITREQWATLQLMTTQRCVDWTEIADVWGRLSPEAKEMFRSIDKEKAEQINAMFNTYITSSAFWRVSWKIAAGIGVLATIWKTFGEYITVKLK